MAALYDALETYLKSRSSVTALIGAGSKCRMYFDRLRQGVSMPALVWVEGSGGEVGYDLSGLFGVGQSIWHAYEYGSTRREAETLDAAVLSALCGSTGLNMRGRVDDVHVKSVTPSQRFWEFDQNRDAADQPRYIARRVYSIWHDEVTT